MSSLCDKRGEARLFIKFILVKTRKLTLLASNVYDLHFSKRQLQKCITMESRAISFSYLMLVTIRDDHENFHIKITGSLATGKLP